MHRHVGDGGVGARLRVFVAFAVVRFNGVVGRVGLFDVEVLNATGPAVGPVQGVVRIAGERDVSGVHSAAEELHAVVEIVVDLNVFHRRRSAHGLERDAVQLVLRVHVGAGEAHADVAQRARVVVGVGTAEEAGVGLALLHAAVAAAGRAFGTVVDRCVAVDDQAAPETTIAVFGIAEDFRLGREQDRLFGGAVGDDGAAPFHHYEILVGGADHHRPRRQRDLARRQRTATACRGTVRRRDSHSTAHDLVDDIVAKHQPFRIDGAVARGADVDGVDRLVVEPGAGRFAGIGDDAAQGGGNDRCGSRTATAAGVVAVVIVATSAASATAAFDRHFHDHRPRRHVLRRATRCNDHRDKRQRTQAQQAQRPLLAKSANTPTPRSFHSRSPPTAENGEQSRCRM